MLSNADPTNISSDLNRFGVVGVDQVGESHRRISIVVILVAICATIGHTRGGVREGSADVAIAVNLHDDTQGVGLQPMRN